MGVAVMNKQITFDLPTEAQWEYACRTGCLDERYGELRGIAWYYGNSNYKTHPVGQKLPNAWGLHDMIGNIYEWCRDGYRDYEERRVKDPIGMESRKRMCRGGGWFSSVWNCRSAFRHGENISCNENSLGFRLSLVPDA